MRPRPIPPIPTPCRRLACAALLLALLPGLGTWLADDGGRRDLRLGRVDASAAYAAAAEAWGFDLVLEEALHPAELRVDLEEVTRDETLAFLTVAADHFWWVDGEGAVHVSRDTPNERERVTAAVETTYRLERAEPSQVRSALRTFGARRAEAGEESVEAVLWEPLAPHADEVVAAMDGRAPAGWSVRWLAWAPGLPAGPPDLRLLDGPRKRLWFPEPTPVVRLLDTVEGAWDVEVVLDPALLDPGVASLRLEGATLLEALDALTVSTGRFWTPLGGRRFLVAEDTPRKRRSWEPTGFATLRLERVDPATVQSVLRELRVRAAFAGSSPPVVLVRDTPHMLAVARFVGEHLDGRDPLSVPDLERLWLGIRNRPRLAEAQLLVDPATPADRLRVLAVAQPPEVRAPASEHRRRGALPWGVAAVPVGRGKPVAPAAARRLEALELEAHVRAPEPQSLLFATGPWAELGSLLAARGAEASTDGEDSPRRSSEHR